MHTSQRHLLILAFVIAALTVAGAQTPLRLVNVTPCRLVDTRAPNGNGPFQGTVTFDLRHSAQLGGAYGTCTPFDLSAAQAYALNVTLVPAHGRVGYLTIWPTGEPQPSVSLLNSDGRIKANAAIVPSGTNGQVSVFVTDTTDVLIDINAYFDSASDTSALAFFPLTPCRIVDTRNNQQGGTLQAGQERDYPIPGNCGMPADASAYSFNVTALPTNGRLSYMTVWPQGENQPTVSTLNDLTGTVVANAAIVPAGPNSKTAFFVTNNTDLLVDVNGYFAPANAAPNPLSLFTLTPCRVLDTRGGIGLFSGTIPVGVVGSSCGIPGSNQEAFVLNATVVPNGPRLFLTLWPEGQIQPVVSTLNANDGAVTSNMAIVPAGEGNDAIDAYAFSSTNLILDISGYFAPTTAVAIDTTSLPDGTLQVGYSAPLVASGGIAPYTWSRTSGALPPGLNLSASGTISGTPTSTGTFDFTAQARDSDSPAGTATANLHITVDSVVQTLAITTTSLPGGGVNNPYNVVLSANGGVTPYSWSILSGSLPVGLTLIASSGQITGTPGAAGLSQFTVMVTDAQNHTATKPLGIAVNSGNTNGTLNGTYALTFTAFDASIPIVSAASVTLDGNGNVVAGEFDELTAGSQPQHSPITGGSYSVDGGGLGSLTLETPAGNETMLLSIGSSQDIRLLADNPVGPNGIWGSGVMRQQNLSQVSLAALAGNWTYGFAGFDPGSFRIAGAGTYHQDSGGGISNGQEDVNDAGTLGTFPFSGNVSGPDANGRFTLQLNFGGDVLNFAAYAVSANELLIIQTDPAGNVANATSLRRNGTMNNGILNGNAVGREIKRANNSGTLVDSAGVLLAAFDGQGNVTLTLDGNRGGVITHHQTAMDVYNVASNGRASISDAICYVVQHNESFCTETTSGNPGLLFIESQANIVFNNATLSGQFLGGTLPETTPGNFEQIDTNVFDGVGAFDSIYSQSGQSGTTQNLLLNGTYAVDSTGAITISHSGNPIYYGWLVGPNRYYLISLDDNPRVDIEVRSSAP